METKNTFIIGQQAPYFKAKAVVKEAIVPNFSLADYQGKTIVFFFYPLDFTFVCPTELHAFQEKLHEFEKRNTQVVACSVDSVHTHLAWLNTPREKGGIAGVTYPIVSDLNKTIARAYGVLKEDEGVAYRGLFLIDRAGIVQHQLVNELPLGRSVDEALRMVDALSFHEHHGEVCPANWKSGAKGMIPSAKGLQDYFAR